MRKKNLLLIFACLLCLFSTTSCKRISTKNFWQELKINDYKCSDINKSHDSIYIDLNTPLKFSPSTSSQSHSSLDSAFFKAAAILKCPLFDSLTSISSPG